MTLFCRLGQDEHSRSTLDAAAAESPEVQSDWVTSANQEEVQDAAAWARIRAWRGPDPAADRAHKLRVVVSLFDMKAGTR